MATRWIHASALVAGMALLIGCEPVNETETVPDTTTTPPAGTTPGTTGTGVDAQREQLINPLMDRLEDARERIETLRAAEDRVPTEQRPAFESAMASVQSAYSNAVLQVDRLREAQGAELNQMRGQVDTVLESLEASIDRAENIVEGQGGQTPPLPPTQPGQQPGQQPQTPPASPGGN